MKRSFTRRISAVVATAMLFTSATSNLFINAYADDAVAAVVEEALESGNAAEVAETAVETDNVTVAADEAVEPEQGKSYSYDFTSDESFTSYTSDSRITSQATSDGIVTVNQGDGTNQPYYYGSHGLVVYNGNQIDIVVAGNATITMTNCYYSADGNWVFTDADGNQLGTVAAKGSDENDKDTAVSFNYKGDAGTITATLETSGSTYFHGISIANDAAETEASLNAESFDYYFDDYVDADGYVAAGTYELKGGVLELNGAGETNFSNDKAGVVDSGFTREKDGETVSLGMYKAGSRPSDNNLTKRPAAGDGTSVVFTPYANGMVTFLVHVNTAGKDFRCAEFIDNEKQGSTTNVYAEGATEYSINVQAGHSYAVCAGGTNEFRFVGVRYFKNEDVDTSVTLNVGEGVTTGGLEIYLTDPVGNVETVTSSTSTLTLLKGHTYTITTNDGGIEATSGESKTFTADGSALTLDLVAVPDVELKGEITFSSDDVDASCVESITFTKMSDSTVSYTYTAEEAITGNEYSVIIKPGEYNTSVATTNGYSTSDRVSVSKEGAENEIYLEKDLSKYDLPTEIAASETSLIFSDGVKAHQTDCVNAAAGSTITVPVSGVQNVTVAGWWAGTWDINGEGSVTADSSSSAASPATTTYTTNGTETSVTVNTTGNGANYLYWIKVEDVIDFKSELNVPGDYDTLGEAVSAIKNMQDRPDGEKGRVTINLKDDIFEQVVFDAPYITLNGNNHEISWYYGLKSKYYSIGSDGLYSESLFRDKYSKTSSSEDLWGGVAIIKGDNFKAVNTTFKNTYNYYVTDKEIEDGAEYISESLGVRTKDTDVTESKYKERANAFYIGADNIEAYNCKILSSQDTLGRNGSTNYGFHTYFKDCVIGGNVDYICGEFTAVFDGCELQWKTYSDTSKNSDVGYIVAPKTSPYIFRNCEVTALEADTSGVSVLDDSSSEVLGKWGRTWGESSCAYFINCETNGYISSDGWGQMNDGDGKSAIFCEYGNTENGEPFTTTGTEGVVTPTILTEENDAELIETLTSDEVLSEYLDDWTPTVYVTEEEEEQSGAVREVILVGDSTACEYGTDSNYRIGRNGYGMALESYASIPFKNLAISGRSSKDFLTTTENSGTIYLGKTYYEVYLDSLSQGDTVLIAWGHNDEKPENVDRFSFVSDDENPETVEGSFQYNLYNYYIKPALDAGANPVLVTPIVRRSTGSYTKDKVHNPDANATTYLYMKDGAVTGSKTLPSGYKTVTIDGLTGEGNADYMTVVGYLEDGTLSLGSSECVLIENAGGGDYAQAIRELADEYGLLCIDNTETTKSLYESLGTDGTALLHAEYNDAYMTSKGYVNDDGSYNEDKRTDNTHLRSYGAKVVAQTMVDAIKDGGNNLVVKSFTNKVTAPSTPKTTVGDTTGDDKITATDALLALQYGLNSDSANPNDDDFMWLRADVTNDYTVTATDALQIILKALDDSYTFTRTQV